MTSYKIAVLPGDGIGKKWCPRAYESEPWDVSLISNLPGKSMIGAARLITKPVG